MSRVLIVTGGGRGIGAATCLEAAVRGYRVCVNYLANRARADGVVHEIRDGGGTAIAIQADVASEDDVVRLFETVDGELGPLTGLVNAAGTNEPQTRVEDVEGDALARCLAVNVIGSMLSAREAIRRLSTTHGGKGGAIVNVSSAAARLGGGGRVVPYATSKGAIDTFTFGLAQEVAAEGVRVNAVSPGVIDTEMQPPGRIEQMAPTLPMRRAGDASEVAQAILWLLSDEASYVSGTVLDVSGGR